MSEIKNILAINSFLLLALVTSCSENNPTPTVIIDTPSTYEFSRNGSSTVSFEGQSTRIAMAEEIIVALLSSDLTEASIEAMFDHQEGGLNFSNSQLNASGKNVKSKVAASYDLFSANTVAAGAVKADFDSWIARQVSDVFSKWSTDASEGVAGAIQEAGGGPTRYVNQYGLEYNQAFTKALIGALMTDQALNNYLGLGVLDAGSNREDQENGVTEEGENFTSMEHKWDEAYGYLYGASQNPSNPNETIGMDDSFLNKYIGQVAVDPDFSGISDEIFNAFKLGRAAIVAGEYAVRDEQVAIIRQNISEVIAIRAVYYLQQAKKTLEAPNPDMGSAFHDLSEGFGFLYSLQFTRRPGTEVAFFSRTEVQGFIDTIYPTQSGKIGFWDVTPSNLQSVSESIVAEFGFTIDQAGS